MMALVERLQKNIDNLSAYLHADGCEGRLSGVQLRELDCEHLEKLCACLLDAGYGRHWGDLFHVIKRLKSEIDQGQEGRGYEVGQRVRGLAPRGMEEGRVIYVYPHRGGITVVWPSGATCDYACNEVQPY